MCSVGAWTGLSQEVQDTRGRGPQGQGTLSSGQWEHQRIACDLPQESRALWGEVAAESGKKKNNIAQPLPN